MSGDFSRRSAGTPTDTGTGSSSLRGGEGEGDGPWAAVRFYGGIDYAALRQRVGIRDVLTLLAWQPTSATGLQLRGPCPIHGSASPQSRSFSVNAGKNLFQCFGCGKKGNQLDLFALAAGLPLYLAAVELCQRLGVDPPRRSERS